MNNKKKRKRRFILLIIETPYGLNIISSSTYVDEKNYFLIALDDTLHLCMIYTAIVLLLQTLIAIL